MLSKADKLSKEKHCLFVIHILITFGQFHKSCQICIKNQSNYNGMMIDLLKAILEK